MLSNIFHWPLSIGRVWKRELCLAFRDQAVVIFFIVLCAVYPVLYSLIYNTEVARDVQVVVVDDNRSHLTREFVRMLDATPEVCVTDYVSNMPDARRLMNEHECYGIVYFPADFTRKALGGEQGHVSLYTDMGVLMRYKQLLVALTKVQLSVCSRMQQAQIGIVSANTASSSGGGGIIESREVALGNTAMGVASAVLPCILLMVLQQSMILGICVLRGGSRERRLHHRGIDPEEIPAGVGATIIGKTLCHLLIYILPAIYVLHFVPIFFDFPQNGDPLHIIALILPFLLGASLLGQTLQVFVNDRESTFLVMAFTSVIFVFLSGISWPRYMMSDLWTALGNAIPSTWASNAYIAIHTTGATLEQVSGHYYMLWILVAFYFVAAYMVERFICRPRYRRMQHYAAIHPHALLNEERRRNAVDTPDW
ncbi:MAG: ABC transporter permease [Bacteroidales bacterium]|nr:ABC transporter permease [Bacteroidales bacterium]